MIDIILLFFILAVFYGGFWCGKRYASLGAMFQAFVGWFESLWK